MFALRAVPSTSLAARRSEAMTPIPLSQFDPRQHAEFDLQRLFQCSDIKSLESDVEALRKGLEAEALWHHQQDGKTHHITFGPVVVGEATAVTDHIDVYQYYRLVPKA